MEQEVLIINAINSIQKQHHGRLVVWYKTGRHFWLNNLTICSFDKINHKSKKCTHTHIVGTDFKQPPFLTFAIRRDLDRQADDSYQVFYWYQRPKNGSDS